MKFIYVIVSLKFYHLNIISIFIIKINSMITIGIEKLLLSQILFENIPNKRYKIDIVHWILPISIIPCLDYSQLTFGCAKCPCRHLVLQNVCFSSEIFSVVSWDYMMKLGKILWPNGHHQRHLEQNYILQKKILPQKVWFLIIMPKNLIRLAKYKYDIHLFERIWISLLLNFSTTIG